MLHLQIIFITQEGRDDSSVWEMGFFWILCIHNILLTILLLNSIPATTKGVTPAVKFINNKHGNSHQSFQDSWEKNKRKGKRGIFTWVYEQIIYTIPKAPTTICQVISTWGAESEETSATAHVLNLNFLYLTELLTQFLEMIIFWLEERFNLNVLLVWCFE